MNVQLPENQQAAGFWGSEEINPFRAPESLSILNPSNFVPKNGFPVVKGF